MNPQKYDPISNNQNENDARNQSSFGSNRVIQPLTPEADIIQAISMEKIPGNTSAPQSADNAYGNNGHTETSVYNQQQELNGPPTPPYQQIRTESEQNNSAASNVTVNRKSKKGIVITILLLMLVAVGIAGYYFMNNHVSFDKKLENLSSSSSKAGSSLDLKNETYENTSFQLPSYWVNANETSASSVTYHEMPSESQNTRIGSITVTEKKLSSLDASFLKNNPSQLRKMIAVNAVSNLAKIQDDPMYASCSKKPESHVIQDATQTANTQGMTMTTTTCSNENGGITTKTRVVAGNDSILRTITLNDTTINWEQRSDTYQKILNSVELKK